MRSSTALILFLVTFLGMPSLASAANSGGCSSAGPACTIVSASDGVCTQNIETGDFYCQPKPNSGSQSQPLGPGRVQQQSQPLGGGTLNQGTTLVNPLGANTTLMSLLQRILDFVIQIGAVIVILMLVYVGYKFVVAQGNETKITEARNMLLWTVIGALILLGAKVIATGIEATVNALMVGK